MRSGTKRDALDGFHRAVEKAGGWEFIRRKADRFWQEVADDRSFIEHTFVDHLYGLAGWDDPPRKRTG